MKRKVNKVSKSTLTVTLPAAFVKSSHVQAGDDLDVSWQNHRVTYITKEVKPTVKSTTISADNHTFYSLARSVVILYRAGIDRIIIISSSDRIANLQNDEQVNLKRVINRIVGVMMGAEIISQTGEKTEIQIMVPAEEVNLDDIERRIHLLLKEMMDEMTQSIISKRFSLFYESLWDHHDHIVKFINYLCRELRRSQKSDEEKAAMISLYMAIDKIIDKLRHLSGIVFEDPIPRSTLTIIISVFDYVQRLSMMLRTGMLEHGLLQEQYRIHKKIIEEFSKHKKRHLLEIYAFIDLVDRIVELIIIRDMAKSPIYNKNNPYIL